VPETLQFEPPRIIPELHPRMRELPIPWLAQSGLADEDRPQFFEVMRRFGAKVDEERFERAPVRELFTGPLEGFEDAPIETWDIVDGNGTLRFTLWIVLYAQGFLFEAGTTTVCGEILHSSFEADESALGAFEGRPLSLALMAAQKRALRRHRNTCLADVRFARTFTY
jgi:hypothetical protein